MSSLSDEILTGNLNRVKEWLSQSTYEVNDIDAYGFTPLIEATIINNVEMARLLLDYGAKVNQEDMTGGSALHWAVENNNIPMCKLLLENSADVNCYSAASQPLLVKPLLRGQKEIKELLYRHGADLQFTLDFINSKLLGHRFELRGVVDIINSQGDFVELDVEGFYLEFTMGIIQNSLQRYRNNFAARHLRNYFKRLQKVIDTLAVASELIKYQHYLINASDYNKNIDRYLDNDMLVIPIAHRGHATTFVYYRDWLIRCDRGEASKIHGTVVLYQMGRPDRMTKDFIKKLMYEKQTPDFMQRQIDQYLQLSPITAIPVPAQLTGNCSWANVEAAIPALLFILLLIEKKRYDENDLIRCKTLAVSLYQQWEEWDQDGALHECVESFYQASPARKASKAAILGAILFQRCSRRRPKDIERAQKILNILMLEEYNYVLRSYIKAFWKDSRTKRGENLVKLLKICGIEV